MDGEELFGGLMVLATPLFFVWILFGQPSAPEIIATVDSAVSQEMVIETNGKVTTMGSNGIVITENGVTTTIDGTGITINGMSYNAEQYEEAEKAYEEAEKIAKVEVQTKKAPTELQALDYGW